MSELRRVKATATALLAAALVVYVLTLLSGAEGWLGFVRAGAEAAMVGGLADWFAVTALFRHPLGLPIPHTALVPTRKAELAGKLGEFVRGHFLTPEALLGQLRERDVVRRVAEWAADPQRTRRFSEQVTRVVVDAVDQPEASTVITEAAVRVLRADAAGFSYAGRAGRLVDLLLADRAHADVVGEVCGWASAEIRRNEDFFADQLQDYVETSKWGWLLITSRRAHKMVLKAADDLAAASSDRDHPIRVHLDGLLTHLARDLQQGRGLAGALDAFVATSLAKPQVATWLTEIVTAVLGSVRSHLASGDGSAAVTRLLQGWGEQVLADPEQLARVEAQVASAVEWVLQYADAFDELIVATVARWDGRDASERIESAVGRDLQFIRINGTVVGATAGLVIHAVSTAIT